MKRILGSLIDCRDFTQEQIQGNYRMYQAVDLEWIDPGHRAVLHAIEAHFKLHAELPSAQILRDHFDSMGVAGVEGGESLKDALAAKPYIRTNFRQLLTNLVEEQRKVRFIGSLRQAHEISQKQGVDEALGFFETKLKSFTKATQEAKLATLSTADIFARLEPLKWACEGLRIAPGGITLMAGYGDSAKSILAQYLILCFVAGIKVFGLFAVEKVKVLHLDYEQGARLSRERYIRLARGMGLDLETLVKDGSLRLASMPNTYLDDKEAEDIIRASIEDVGLVMFDSFKASSPDTEENSSAARKPLDMLIRVCGDDRVVLGIHHSRKPREDAGKGGKADPRMMMRGSAGIYDALQGGFFLEREREDQQSPIRVHHVKERQRGIRLDTFGFRVVDVPAPDGKDASWGLRVEYVSPQSIKTAAPPADAARTKRCQAVLSVITTANPPGLAAGKTATFAGYSLAKTKEYVATLLQEGYIAEREEKRGKTTGTYYFPIEGRATYTPPVAPVGMTEPLTQAQEDAINDIMEARTT